jgi:hypothetical protein
MPGLAAQRISKVSAFIFVIACSPATVMAEGVDLNIMTDLEYLYSNIETEDKVTGEKTETDFSRFKQEYDIELLKEIYPYLNLRLGGLFELIDTGTSSDGSHTETDERSAWLFAELNLDNPLYTAGAAYRRREFEFNPEDIPQTRISREEYSGLFRWRPVGFPRFDLDFNRFHIWDDAETRDSVLDRFILQSRYDYRDFSYDYTYTRNDENDRIDGFGTLTQIHNGNMNYSTRFFNDRLLVNGAVRLNYQTLEPTGEGEIERPTTAPGSEFYLLDDSDPGTLQEVDAAHPLTLVNIGRNAAPVIGVGVGLDFGLPTDVDTLYVLPLADAQDPLLATPGEIAWVAGFYTWSVFSSDDQLTWTLVTPAAEANYNVFDNRFEISFPPVIGTRYIKVVTAPRLSAPGEIRIAEIRAFTTIPVSPGMVIEDFDQTYNLGLQWAITDRTTTSYDGLFRMMETEPFDLKRTTLTNSISLRHIFGPRLFANARLLRTDTTETERDDAVNHSYTASITADYLDTLRQTLIYSGRHDKEGSRTGTANSIFLRTDADLYKGWSADVDLGYSWQSPLDGDDNTSATLRISTDVDPNPRLSFSLDYLVSWNTEEGRPSSIDQYARFQGFWHPVRTLSFFGAVSLRHKQSEGEGLKIAQDYSVNWAPFPDGWLNLSLAYNYSVDTNNNETRVFSPQIDWQIARSTFLNLRFNLGTFESERQTSDVKNIRLTLRASY